MTLFVRGRWSILIALVAVGLGALVSACSRESTNAVQKSFDEIRRSAEGGNAADQYELGLMYSTGHAAAQDYSKALMWYQRSASQGNAMGENALGFLYSSGRGVPQSYAEALRWYQMAAQQGNSKAEFNIGNLYYYGRGVTQDHSEAYRWYNKAADHGNEEAQRLLGQRWMGRDIGSRVILPVVAILTLMYLANTLRRGQSLREPRYRALATITLVTILYLVGVVYWRPSGMPMNSLLADHVSFLIMNIIIGVFLAQLSLLLWPDYSKLRALVIIGIAFLGFNAYVAFHAERLNAASALHAFYLADGLIAGIMILLGVALMGDGMRHKPMEGH